MKRVLPDVTASATSAITATSADKLAYLCNVQRLSQLFYTGHRYILSHNVSPAVWSTIHQPLADGFTRKYADPLCLLGVGFGDYTSYLVDDIDRRSKYHPCNDPKAFERFLDTLYKIGLTTPVIIQSSWSGGIHVYNFLDRDLNTFRIAALKQVTLINAGFEISHGTLELFPNCKPFASEFEAKTDHTRHRLPVQPNGGGLLLDRKGNPLINGENDNHETQLAAFLALAKASARGNDSAKIERQLDPFYAIFKNCPSKYQHMHKKGMSDKAKAWKIDLEGRMGIGWTSFSETNTLIPKFIAYGIVFIGLEDQKELFEWVLEAITNANGYKRYCCHQHQIQARIWDWLKLTTDKQFYVKYCGYPPRSSDRDNFIAKNKVSKALPITKSEVYRRARVELVASKIQETVETILATIADLPNRIGDVIQLIQSTARQKFGQAFSRTTLYKPHYKHIWVNLLATKKVYDIVLVTSITPTNMEYQTQICTESAFESSISDTTSLPKTNLKPTGDEASHRVPGVCSVNIPCRPHPVNEADPDLDLAPNSVKNIPLDPDFALQPIESTRTPDLIDSNSNSQPDSIDLSTADLISRSAYDRDKSIEPDPIHLQSALPNLDTSHQPNQIESPGVDLTSRSSYPHADPIKPDPTDRDKSIEPDPDQIHPKLPTIPNSIDFGINYQSNQTEPAQDDLTSLSLLDRDKSITLDLIKPDRDPIDPISHHDRDKSIEPDSTEPCGGDLTNPPSLSHDQLIPIDPNLDSSHSVPDPIDPDPIDPDPIDPDPIDPAHKKNDRVQLLDIDDPEHQSSGVVCAMIGSRAMVKWDVSRKLNTYPISDLKIINPKTPKKLTEAQETFLYAEKSKYLAQLIPYSGCIVRPVDVYHVHGSHKGSVTVVERWGVYVSWQDGSSGRYAVNELICTYSPCANNFIQKLIDRSQVPVSES